MVVTTAILMFSVALQSVLGFGLGMVSIPLLLCQGLPLSHAVFLGLSVSLFSSLVAWRRMGDDLPWRESVTASAYRLLGIIPGLGLAAATAGLSAAALKGLIGAAVGLGVLAQAGKMLGGGRTVAPGTPPSARLAPAAFLCSGLLTGWLGMGGPPLIFWQLSGRADSRHTRGFLFGVYVLTLPVQLALMLWADPEGIASLFPLLLLNAPLTWWVGEKALAVGDRLSVGRLQWASLVFLALLSLRSLVDWAMELAR